MNYMKKTTLKPSWDDLDTASQLCFRRQLNELKGRLKGKSIPEWLWLADGDSEEEAKLYYMRKIHKL